MKNNSKPLGFIIVISIILAIAIIALLVYNIITKNNSNSDNKTVIDTSTGQALTGEQLELYSMNEADRMKYYFNIYIKHIDNKEYDQAYSMLDDKFKNNYFKTLDSYTKYLQSKYPSILSVTYDDILRMGNYYVIDVTFLDLFASVDENMVGKAQKFVIYETDYNEYKMSFQAE